MFEPKKIQLIDKPLKTNWLPEKNFLVSRVFPAPGYQVQRGDLQAAVQSSEAGRNLQVTWNNLILFHTNDFSYEENLLCDFFNF